MINLKHFKAKRLEHFNQLILLDNTGKVAQSCNSIFNTAPYKEKSIQEDIPILESIFDIVKKLEVNSPEILFSKVQHPFQLLKGFYDFTFSKIIIDGKEYILWSVYDFTALYKDLIDYQQRYNEFEIRKQLEDLLLYSNANNTYLQSMLATLHKPVEESLQEFDFKTCIQSVFNAFSYQYNVTFNAFEVKLPSPLYGDVTWFKFMLYNLLDAVFNVYQTVIVQPIITVNNLLNTTYVNLKFSFKGITSQLELMENIFQNDFLDKEKLSSKAQNALFKLYNVQKIIHQNKGYLELKPLDTTFKTLEILVTFNCQFKYKY